MHQVLSPWIDFYANGAADAVDFDLDEYLYRLKKCKVTSFYI
jgi:hypothetical protein